MRSAAVRILVSPVPSVSNQYPFPWPPGLGRGGHITVGANEGSFAGDTGKVNFVLICGGKPNALENPWKCYGVTGGERRMYGFKSGEERQSLDDT